MNLHVLYKNGVHIILHSLLISYLLNPLLGIYYYLKMFSWNYYVNFNYLYDNPNLYKWKHMIRLTDTGHIANLLYFFYPSTLPVCHNIHFVISIGYYTVKIFFGMQDSDDRIAPELYAPLQDIHCNLNHSVPFLILLVQNSKNDYEFNNYTLLYSYLWVYCWLFFIYIPWRYYTNDPVYSVLQNNISNKKKIIIIVLIHVLLYSANKFGELLQTYGRNFRTNEI